jgi:DNA invertase Pin-like site-specific DNA recombinase
MKAIIRARVSTKGQEEGHSIAAQRLVESSTRGERKEFAAMLAFAQA